MRDRLDHLQTISESNSQLEEVESDSFSNVDLEDFSQQAVIYDNSDEMDSVLDEAQDTRREIQFIRLEVKRLRDQNTRILSEPTRTTHVKQDANVIVGDIKTRGQDVLARLQKMDAHAKELEEEHGLNSAVARIARTQYATLSNNFRDVFYCFILYYIILYYYKELNCSAFSHLADTFFQSDLQMRTIEAIKPTKVQQYVTCNTPKRKEKLKSHHMTPLTFVHAKNRTLGQDVPL
uniref:Syntaxin-11-like n=1 Tax=Sinocyclocheilus rhinocerous TaxID=307959 RepID=A0A673NDI2_9TELE